MNEFVENGDFINVNVPFMEAYIPFELFTQDAESKSAVASPYGEGYRVIGQFNVRCFDNDQQERFSKKLKTFNYPNYIITYPSASAVETISIDRKKEAEKYIIFKYYKGDIMMSTYSKMDNDNCEAFLNILMRGKIPTTIEYGNLLKTWETNFEINGFEPGVPSLTLQVILSHLCRNPNDFTQPYRMIAGRVEKAENNYAAVNMEQAAANTSVMAGLTFQNMGAMLTTGLNISKKNIKQSISPAEKVLSM